MGSQSPASGHSEFWAPERACHKVKTVGEMIDRLGETTVVLRLGGP